MKNLKKGFTIIEMVIVIAIIGILASVLIPTYGNVVAQANQSAAQQTARSVMANWLASSTSASGVPTSGKNSYGDDFYAAYFEVPGQDGINYFYRYTSGGVELLGKESKDNIFNSLPVINRCYLTTPLTPNFDPDTYVIKVYQQAMPAGYNNYYLMYPTSSGTETKYVYDFGGATVYAATNANQKIYTYTETTGNKFTDVKIWEQQENGDVYGYKSKTEGDQQVKDGDAICIFKAQTCSGATFENASSISSLTTTNSVAAGASLELSVTYTGEGTLTWSSSNTSVATVVKDSTDQTKATVTGVAADNVTITVTDGKDTKTFNLTVTANS